MYVVSPLSIYLLGLVDSLVPILFVGAIILLIVAFFTWGEVDTSWDMSESTKSKYLNISKKCIVASIVMILLWTLIPSKKNHYTYVDS